MLGTHDLLLFIVSGFLLNITPGADSLYIVTRSVSQGARAGIVAVAGVIVGCSLHVLAAALGLSALLATSASAFALVKWLGAAYLVYMGISLLRSRPAVPAPVTPPVTAVSLTTVFVQGLLTDLLNPKVALFFLAFVPQFIAPAAPSKALAFLFLGGVFIFNGALWCLFLVWSAVRLAAFAPARRASHWLGRGVGCLFVFLGVRLFFAKPG